MASGRSELIGTCFFLVFALLPLFSCVRHDEVLEGEGYGFAIGDSKRETFEKALRSLHSGEFQEFGSNYNRPDVEQRFSEELRSRPVADLTPGFFEKWDSWRVTYPEANAIRFVDIRFEHGRINRIDRVMKDGGHAGLTTWETGMGSGLTVSHGDNRDSVLKTLNSDPTLSVEPLWSSRRIPEKGEQNEFWTLADEDTWYLLIDGHYSNSIRLDFSSGKLSKIARHKGELP